MSDKLWLPQIPTEWRLWLGGWSLGEGERMCCPQSLPGCSESEIKTCQNPFIFLNVFLLSASVGKHENSDAYI